MNTFQIIIQFIISGAIVVGAMLLSRTFDSKWAGLLVALPTMTLLGLFFIHSSTSTEITQRYLISAILFMVPAAVYLLSMYLMYGKISLTANFLISIVPFGLSVFFIQKIIS